MIKYRTSANAPRVNDSYITLTSRRMNRKEITRRLALRSNASQGAQTIVSLARGRRPDSCWETWELTRWAKGPIGLFLSLDNTAVESKTIYINRGST